MNTPVLAWSDPHGFLGSQASVFVYFVCVTDEDGNEYRYVGQTKRGVKRLKEYRNNVRRIFAGLPRRTTPGQEPYRAVHLALAKACERNWTYALYPLEQTTQSSLAAVERRLRRELQCNLNVSAVWNVGDYTKLEIAMLIR